MKRKVFITNHTDEACGVYQFGKRVAEILLDSNSKDFDYFYIEASDKRSFLEKVNKIGDPDIVVHNYLNITMPWLDEECLGRLGKGRVPQGLIVHNIGYSLGFDFYLHQHPDYPDNGINHSLCRPLYDYKPEPFTPSSVPKFGTFGFGFIVKEYEKIVQLINSQFDEAEINMHLTYSKFCPNISELEGIKIRCKESISKDGISLNITSDFRTDEEILRFLGRNDLNVFLYKDYKNYNGISSVIDYAISAQRPFAVCKSNMFAHVNYIEDLCVEKTPLARIIECGDKYTEGFRQRWDRKNFVNKTEGILKKYV
jgi:hypothetical protein